MLFSGGATFSDIIYRTGHTVPLGRRLEPGAGRTAAKKYTPVSWRAVNALAVFELAQEPVAQQKCGQRNQMFAGKVIFRCCWWSVLTR